MVTIWKVMEALKAFTGEDESQAVIPEEEIPLLEQVSVQHCELFGSDRRA